MSVSRDWALPLHSERSWPGSPSEAPNAPMPNAPVTGRPRGPTRWCSSSSGRVASPPPRPAATPLRLQQAPQRCGSRAHHAAHPRAARHCARDSACRAARGRCTCDEGGGEYGGEGGGEGGGERGGEGGECVAQGGRADALPRPGSRGATALLRRDRASARASAARSGGCIARAEHVRTRQGAGPIRAGEPRLRVD